MFKLVLRTRGSVLLSLVLAFAAACGDDAIDPDEPDYDGDIPACMVEVSDEAYTYDEASQSLEETPPFARRAQPQSETLDLSQPGPYPTWNTSPKTFCTQDPSINQVGETQDVALYITYPAATKPTVSGDGRLAEGRWPVIIFAHANNDTKCNIYRSYRSLQRHWASWGYIVVSVDGTATNCTPGSRKNLELRVEGQLKALARMKELDQDPDSRFFGHLDPEKLVFAGHSRGGGSSLIAAIEHGGAAGVINLQGVDTNNFGYGNPALDFPLLGMTAGRDVDVDYPYVEPTEDQSTGPYTWVNINGAIHANTGDTIPLEPDDTPKIERAQQHAITQLYTTAFLRYYVGIPEDTIPYAQAADILYSRQGAEFVAAELSERGVFQRWNLRLSEGTLIDHYDRSDPDTNELGGANISENLLSSQEVFTYKPEQSSTSAQYRKATSRRLVAGADEGAFRVMLGAEGVTVPAGTTLQARVRGPDSFDHATFAVEVHSTQTQHSAPGAEHIGPMPISNRFTQLIVPLDELIDSEEATLTEVVFRLSDGTLFIDDLRLVPPT